MRATETRSIADPNDDLNITELQSVPVLQRRFSDLLAVEAGAHSFATVDGGYKPLTKWEKTADGDLMGVIEVPMAVGLVGGATKVHPTARANVKILGIE